MNLKALSYKFLSRKNHKDVGRDQILSALCNNKSAFFATQPRSWLKKIRVKKKGEKQIGKPR